MVDVVTGVHNVVGAALRISRSAVARATGRPWRAPATQGLGSRLRVDEDVREALQRALTPPLPPADLVHLVNGHRDLEQFAGTRTATVANIIGLLGEAGVEYRKLRSILDFGCGCGRILAGWEHLRQADTRLYGFDINPALVEFCRKNIPFAEVATCDYLPPLPLADGSIDFAYAASVWTHLSRDASRQWAREFARVIRPGGVALVSYHGTYFQFVVERLGRTARRALQQEGFHMHSHARPGKTFDGSNDYATFMTTRFLVSLFDGFELLRNFEGVQYGPNPFAAYQDIAVLRRI